MGSLSCVQLYRHSRTVVGWVGGAIVTNQMPYAAQAAANVSTKSSTILSSFLMAMSRMGVGWQFESSTFLI